MQKNRAYKCLYRFNEFNEALCGSRTDVQYKLAKQSDQCPAKSRNSEVRTSLRGQLLQSTHLAAKACDQVRTSTLIWTITLPAHPSLQVELIAYLKLVVLKRPRGNLSPCSSPKAALRGSQRRHNYHPQERYGSSSHERDFYCAWRWQ